MEIESFVRQFEECTLPRAEWTHEKHLVFALWCLRMQSVHEATRRIRAGIQRYNRHGGKPNGYHETITRAWIAVIERFLRRTDRKRPVSELASELLEQCGAKDYLFRFYSRDLLLSDEARARFVQPDIFPLPWIPESRESFASPSLVLSEENVGLT